MMGLIDAALERSFPPRNSSRKVGFRDAVVVGRGFQQGCLDDPIRLQGSDISCG